MTTRRFLPGVVLALITAGPASAQFSMPPYSLTNGSVGGTSSARMEPGLPAAASQGANSLDRIAAPTPQSVSPDPYGTLTGQTLQGAPSGGLPPGSYPSPWSTDGPLCCGPLGGGPITYELYLDTGPNFVFGNAPFTSRLDPGWMVNGGGRTLFFNQDASAAWVVDLGMSYSYNHGDSNNPVNLDIRQPSATNAVTGARTNAPDLRLSSTIKALDRTNFNFALGRDWFVWGPGANGRENGWNLRFGGELGGRWGTNHVNLVEVGIPNSYARRQKVSHGIYTELHTNFEVPFGGLIWFGGVKVQYGYDWMDIVPPLNGDIQNINLLLSTGVRF